MKEIKLTGHMTQAADYRSAVVTVHWYYDENLQEDKSTQIIENKLKDAGVITSDDL